MLPPEERPAWLAGLPAEYDLLREPLRRLLEVQAGIQTRPFIDAFTSGIEGLTPPATAIVGDLIGPYRLLQQLGDGGMGSVWLAERADESIKRRVALKLPRMVWARNLETRMARERDILGSLEHPNIARLYDAGVDQLGRPYLALEYVEGERIDAYCDQSKLDVAARIRLFLQVLEAAQYAHVNLVLHRDLKPANVLVNQRGEVRLLDFGIAKLMSDDDNVAAIEQNSKTLARAMTPRYASPEQVQHQRLSLASDVYSLGVMLFELLVGTTPLITQNGSRAEIEIAIIEGNLRTPSRAKITNETAEKRQSSPTKLGRTLRGDLDAILLKALSRNAAERYPSAEMFRADLIRWLEGRPVLAKPPSKLVAIRKFVTRNAVGVSLGTAAIVAVLSSATIAVFHAYQAKVESQRATATRDFLIGLFENANPELHGGRDVTARELLISAENNLAADSALDIGTKADIYTTVGNLWALIGDFARVKEAVENRILVLNRLGDAAIQLSAMLDLAEVYVQQNNAQELTILVSRMGRLLSSVEPSSSELASYLWYRGWDRYLANDASESKKSFLKSADLAESGKHYDAAVRALYGLMLSGVRVGNREEILRYFYRAISLIDRGQLLPADRLRRELELASVMYQLGEYKIGWPLVDKIFREAGANHGSLHGSRAEIQELWVLWAIRIGRGAEAGEWLRARSGAPSTSPPSGAESQNVVFEILEAESMLETGESLKALKKLDSLSAISDRISFDQQLFISVLRMEAYLYTGDLRKLERELKGEIWSISASTGSKNELLSFKLMYEGILRLLSGQFSDSAVLLSAAESEAVLQFGKFHPRTLVVQFNRLVAQELESSDTESTSELIHELGGIVGDLRERVGENHRVTLRASRAVSGLLMGRKEFQGRASSSKRNELVVY